jgi:hypothetical protein
MKNSIYLSVGKHNMICLVRRVFNRGQNVFGFKIRIIRPTNKHGREPVVS